MEQIKIDPEFQSLIQPLKPEEYEQLEANILADGCMNALVLWDRTLIDGHNRYRICTEHDITYQTIDKHFDSREEAIIWICKNQSGRRNLTPEQMSYLIGIQYEAEKIKKAHNQYTKSARTQNDTEQNNSEKATRTRERLAIEHGVGCNTIIRNAQFARAVDTISETAPELKQEILSGKLNAHKSEIIRLAEKPEDERSEIIAQVQSGVPVRQALKATSAPEEPEATEPEPLPDDEPEAENEPEEKVITIKEAIAQLKSDDIPDMTYTPEIFIQEMQGFAEQFIADTDLYAHDEQFWAVYGMLNDQQAEIVLELLGCMQEMIQSIKKAIRRGRKNGA